MESQNPNLVKSKIQKGNRAYEKKFSCGCGSSCHVYGRAHHREHARVHEPCRHAHVRAHALLNRDNT